MTNTDTVEAPQWLSEASQRWFERMTSLYCFRDDPGGLSLLESAAAQLDRLAVLRDCLADAGPMVTDRFGFQKPHPALAEERACSNALRLLLRELDLSDGDDETARIPRHGR